MRTAFVRPLVGGLGSSVAALVLVSRGDQAAGLGAAVLASWCWAAAIYLLTSMLRADRQSLRGQLHLVDKPLALIYALDVGTALTVFVVTVWIHMYTSDDGTYPSVRQWMSKLLVPALAPSATVALVAGGGLSFVITPWLIKKSAERSTLNQN